MDLPNPGIELGSPALQAHSVPTELSVKPKEEDAYTLMSVHLSVYSGHLKPLLQEFFFHTGSLFCISMATCLTVFIFHLTHTLWETLFTTGTNSGTSSILMIVV